MSPTTQSYTVSIGTFPQLTGSVIGNSGNQEAGGWLRILKLPWAMPLLTQLPSPDEPERAAWVRLARKARKRWMSENPY